MANVNDIYELLNTIAVKSFNGGYNRKSFNVAAPSAQLFLYNKMIGNSEVSSGNKHIDNYFAQSSQRNIDRLRNFIKRTQLNVDAQGQAFYPSDYIDLVSCRYNYYTVVDGQTIQQQKSVEPIDNGQQEYVLGSVLFQPDKAHPKMVQYATYIQFYPFDLQQVSFEYYKKPIPMYWGSTIVNNVPVYDPATSVNSGFPDDCLNLLTFIIGNMLGLSIKDPDLSAYTNQKLQTGA